MTMSHADFVSGLGDDQAVKTHQAQRWLPAAAGRPGEHSLQEGHLVGQSGCLAPVGRLIGQASLPGPAGSLPFI
jgi:hypothetical protein